MVLCVAFLRGNCSGLSFASAGGLGSSVLPPSVQNAAAGTKGVVCCPTALQGAGASLHQVAEPSVKLSQNSDKHVVDVFGKEGSLVFPK